MNNKYYILMPGDNMLNITKKEFDDLEDCIANNKKWLTLKRDDGMIFVNINQVVTFGYYGESKSGIVFSK